MFSVCSYKLVPHTVTRSGTARARYPLIVPQKEAMKIAVDYRVNISSPHYITVPLLWANINKYIFCYCIVPTI
jgi:hypothetical protein